MVSERGRPSGRHAPSVLVCAKTEQGRCPAKSRRSPMVSAINRSRRPGTGCVSLFRTAAGRCTRAKPAICRLSAIRHATTYHLSSQAVSGGIVCVAVHSAGQPLTSSCTLHKRRFSPQRPICSVCNCSGRSISATAPVTRAYPRHRGGP